MFEAIYRMSLKPGSSHNYMKAWKIVASYMMQEKGAISSTFYLAENKQDCIIHSRWPNAETNKKCWPLRESDPQKVHAAANIMQEQRESVSHMNLTSSELEDYVSRNCYKRCDFVESNKKNILVYNDCGVGVSAYEIVEMLHQIVDLSVCRILLVGSDYIRELPNWEDNSRLFIMPGGRARPYYDALGAKWTSEDVSKGQMRTLDEIGIGNKRIKEFVENGGSYLGICAGAYYGAMRTVFEIDGDNEIIDQGALNFFPGDAEGPAYGLGKFKYNSEQGAEIASIVSSNFSQADISTYFNGGCFFTMGNDSEIPRDTVLCRYTNIKEGKGKGEPIAAMVSNQVGNGEAILSGFHFETSSFSHTNVEDSIRRGLEKDNTKRLLFAAEVVNRLKVPVRKDIFGQIYAKQVSNLELLMGIESTSAIDPIVCREIKFPVIDSTQTFAKNNESELKQGEWRAVVAEQQTASKGTNSRKWASPIGNIYVTYSILLPKEQVKPSRLQATPQIVALSIMQVLKTFGLKPSYKWVNDVLLENKKVAGIYCESSLVNNHAIALHIGIGVNVNLSSLECQKISQPATSLSQVLSKQVDKGRILALLTESVTQHLTYLFTYGYHSAFRHALQKNLAFKGKSIYLDLEDVDKQVIKGMIAGVADDGALILEDNYQQKKSYHVGRILRGDDLEKHLFRKNQPKHSLKSFQDDSRKTPLASNYLQKSALDLAVKE